ncbi:MAG: 50S ribosomal protein L15 [Chloroflexi bacterium]|nr:50S ribosomal protein L15 [Chloroflexota bacterium]
MKMHELRPGPGARRPRRRVGRGHGSGSGTTAGKGTKGQKARAGGGVHPRFEGGQLPLVQRLPHKRGFTNIFRVEYNAVNVGRLAAFPAGAEVGPAEMVRAGLIKSALRPVKILGQGDVDRALTVRAHKFSAGAKSKIEAAGGTAAEIGASAAPTSEEAESTPGA